MSSDLARETDGGDLAFPSTRSGYTTNLARSRDVLLKIQIVSMVPEESDHRLSGTEDESC